MRPEIGASDRALIARLRQEHRAALTAAYDTDFNLLRWLQGYERDVPAASAALGRHLLVRRAFNLDGAHRLRFRNPALRYLPLTFLGAAAESKDTNTLFLLGDRPALYDAGGLMQSLSYAEYFLYHVQQCEAILALLNEAERRTGRQAALVFYEDCEHLRFDHHLFAACTGPNRMVLAAIMQNYPELVAKVVVFNGPIIVRFFYNAIVPFLPQRTRVYCIMSLLIQI